MANPTYIGKTAKRPRDRVEYLSLRGDRKECVAKADAFMEKLKAEGCKVVPHWGSDLVTISVWNPQK